MLLMRVLAVIVIVPVAVGAPAVGIAIPPAMVVIPAIAAGLSQFMPPVFCWFTSHSMVLNGFVQIVVRFVDAFLAIVVGTHQHGTAKNSAANIALRARLAGSFPKHWMERAAHLPKMRDCQSNV
jgi:hypothetical protein